MPTHTNPRRPHGFSVVELMISVAIGMLAIMFATRLIVNGEQNKAASLGGSDQMQNGMLALFSLNGDAAQAGWGLNDPLIAGCDTQFSDANGYQLLQTARGGVNVTPLAAVVIQNNPNGSDQISLSSGTALSGNGSVPVGGAYAGGDSIIAYERAPFGFQVGDVLLIAPEPNDGRCGLVEMTALPGGPTLTTLTFAAGARFNTGTLAATFQPGKARIYNLGPSRALSFHTWSVQNGVLLMRATNLAGASAAPASVVDNIVALKAQYGFDTRVGDAFDLATSMQVNLWSNTMVDADADGVAGGAGDFGRVAAVRVAVVARSKSAEKPDPATGQCGATTAAPAMFDGGTSAGGALAVPVTVPVAVGGDATPWQCYRYRVFETIVPIRNSGWRPS